MAKTKNIDIWNYYLNLINERDRQFVVESSGKPIPEKIYQVGRSGILTECFVTGVCWSKHRGQLWYTTKTPSNGDCERIKAWYDANPPIELKDVSLEYYSYWGEGYKSSSAHMFYDSTRNQGLFLDKMEAELFAEQARLHREEEKAFDELHKKDKSYNYNANGYKFLGWQNGWKHVYFDDQGNITADPAKRRSFGYTKEDYPEYGNCRELKHRTISVQHDQRGSENTVSCPECKIYWKYDSSD